jgi:catechol 2,3-dioxygenase-like lactoylglutathione lyase family enzyme
LLNKAGFATLIAVKNMDRALNFYTKRLGAKLQMRAHGQMKNMWASIKFGKEDFWLIHPPGPPAKKLDLAFSAFIVKDVKKEVAELRKKGVRFQRAEKMDANTVVDGAVATDPYGSTAFFNDSEGNLLMLWQTA